jgi:hypothetical protein
MKDLRDRIDRSAECVSNEIFPSTWQETEYRFDVRRATKTAILISVQHVRYFVRSSV